MRARFGHGAIAAALALATFQPACRIRAEDRMDSKLKRREQIGEALGKPIFRDEIRIASGVTLQSELHRLFLNPVSQSFREEFRTEIQPTEAEIAMFVKAAMLTERLEHERSDAQKNAINEHIEADPDLRRYRNDIEKQLARDDLSPGDRKELEHQRRRFGTEPDEPSQTRVRGMVRKSLAEQSLLRSMASHWKHQKHLHDRYGGGRLLWQQIGVEAYDAKRKWLESEEKAAHFQISDPELRQEFYAYWSSQGTPFLIDDPAEIREYLEPARFLEAMEKENQPRSTTETQRTR